MLRLLYPKRRERPPEGGEGLPKVMNFPNETSILAMQLQLRPTRLNPCASGNGGSMIPNTTDNPLSRIYFFSRGKKVREIKS